MGRIYAAWDDLDDFEVPSHFELATELVSATRRVSDKTQERTALLGTCSFWEGVDVVGEALSCLVIMRLPFSAPSDPILPRAVRRLKIRSRSTQCRKRCCVFVRISGD
jgi:Rad3-related DNA helicase